MKTSQKATPFLGPYYLIIFLFFAYLPTSFSQQVSLKDELLRITALSDSLAGKTATEKLYLQFDKPYYATADTIWFKAYLLNTAFLTASRRSGILYLDVANDSSRVVKRMSIPVLQGLGWGNIKLEERFFAPGTYTVHAYTNWMRNFGEDCFFTKTFYVTSAGKGSWQVNEQHGFSKSNRTDTVNLKLKFADSNGNPEADSPLNLQLMSDGKRLYTQTLQTDANGLLDLSFKATEKQTSLVMIAENEQKDKKAILPIHINHPENTDMQFMPEGGDLVVGLPCHIGFKAIGEDGMGVNLSGIVVGKDGRQLASFKSLHNGMGSFNMAVSEGEVYTAKVTMPGGVVKDYTLPLVKSSGTILHVKSEMDSDSLEISAAATKDIVQADQKFFLVGKARGLVCYAAVVSFRNGSLQRKIAASLFPTGIAHFTLMTVKGQPVNERLVYVDRHDQLNIRIAADKAHYGERDSIAIKVRVTDSIGEPVEGNFSMAVTADAQVKTDTLNNANLLTRMLFTADLKGYIEAPGYYLSSKTMVAWQALDNLLLTQGWVGYNWQDVFMPPKLQFEAEQEMKVSGRVINVFGKPVKRTDVVLFSKSPAILGEMITDDDGRFRFNHIPQADTPIFVLKAVNKKGKSFNVAINMDEVLPPVFTRQPGPVTAPWYVNSDTALVTYNKTNIHLAPGQYDPGNSNLLREVIISAQKIVKGTQNLNGPGNADIILDETDLQEAGKKTWMQLLEEKAGMREKTTIAFSRNGTPDRSFRWYFVDFKPVVLFVDGISVGSVIQPYDFYGLQSYLESHNAEDIKGIEVMETFKFSMRYAALSGALTATFSYVEITTRSGHGPIIDNTPGMYLYKPLAISQPGQFYKPRYAVTDTANHAKDLRSTIDWEPNIVTNRKGEAVAWFYSADNADTYTLTLEGTDMNGSLGHKRAKIKVDIGKTPKKTGKVGP
jgi:hypothetical protein